MILETWLNPSLPDSLIGLNNYSPMREDRMDNRGGGVCIYIKEYIFGYKVYTEKLPNLISDSSCIDSVWIKICIHTLDHALLTTIKCSVTSLCN